MTNPEGRILAFAAARERELVTKSATCGGSRSLFVTEADFANLSLLKPHAALERVLERASVVYPEDADASAGRISVLETAGMQLLGASPGQMIAWNCSGGARALRMEKLVYQPEHSLRTFLVVRG